MRNRPWLLYAYALLVYVFLFAPVVVVVLNSVNANPFRITGNNMVPGEYGFIMYSFSKVDLNFHGGKLCVKTADMEKLFPIKQADPSGIMFRNFNNSIASGTNPMFTIGQKVCVQWYQKDPSNPLVFGDTLSDAVRFVIAP